MPVRLNFYTLQDSIINKMKTVLEETKKDGIEHGFDFCARNNDLVVRNECSGDKCHLKLVKKCVMGEKFVGSYHTHPKTGWAPDMYETCEQDFACLGYNWHGQDRIKCIAKKPGTNIEKCKEDVAPGGRHSVKEHLSHYHELMRKYFKEVDVI